MIVPNHDDLLRFMLEQVKHPAEVSGCFRSANRPHILPPQSPCGQESDYLIHDDPVKLGLHALGLHALRLAYSHRATSASVSPPNISREPSESTVPVRIT